MIRLDTLGSLGLLGTDGAELRAVLAQPKRLALLCYLAVESPRGFQRRDQLFGLFWPELTQAQARQALRQAVYFLRHSLGEPVVANRGTDEIGIALDLLRCDVSTFCDLCARGRLEEALSLYQGDFMAGFFVDGSSAAFEHWLYSTRDNLRQRATDAAWTLADEATGRGAASEAAHWARYASRLDPDDETSLQHLVRLLDSQGDRAGALRAYTEFATALATEFGAEPSAETRALMDTVRSRTTASNTPAPQTSLAVPAPATPQPLPVAAHNDAASNRVAKALTQPDNSTRQPQWRYAALFLILITVGIVFGSRYFRRAPAAPTLAVGWIQDPSGADTSATMRTFAELLATDLARIPGLHVVSRARLYETLNQLGLSEETPSAIADAARRAGATEIIEAVLSPATDSSSRLELRRIDLESGTSSAPQTFQATSIFALADQATAGIAAEFKMNAPMTALADVTTTSLAAQRLYEEGLRAFYRRDVASAVRLFHAALAEDSTFAMSAYYAGLGEQETDGSAARRDLALALRLSSRASERERLIIRQTWAFTTNDPSQLAIAESLAARYPGDPDGELALGRALAWNGDFLGALPHLHRVVHMDSLSLNGLRPWCHACDALALTIDAYIAADSMTASERVARNWTRMQPRVKEPLWFLASVLARENHYDSALAVERRVEKFSTNNGADVITRAIIGIGAGRFADADQMLEDLAKDGNVAQRNDALWWKIISLRNQGRLRDALATAERMVETNEGEPSGFSTPQSLDAVAVAQVQFEMGHFREAAAGFDSIAYYAWQAAPNFTRLAPGLLARHQIWMTTQMVTALAAAHDTVRLAVLEDSISAWAPRSAFFRDRVLDHYARGLIAESRGNLPAAETEFRLALVSPIDGYSRINLELGKVLITEGRARAAIAILQAPLHGSLEASNYYLSQTELHATLGEAFDRAGQTDSAIVHYRRVLSAWKNADPTFGPRVHAIKTRMNSLTSP